MAKPAASVPAASVPSAIVPAAIVNARVGIVSSIPPAALPLASLTAPITAAGHILTPAPEDANGNYDADSKREMKRAVKRLLNVPVGNRPQLVISIGGLVAARGVSDYIDSHDDIPFLACIGRAPNEDSSLWNNEQFVGGINLNTANQNQARGDLLKQNFGAAITSVKNICLYFNKNSHMAKKEAKEWSFFGSLKESSVDHTANNATIQAQFEEDFANLPRGTEAVIVSSDPFFLSKASRLTAAILARFGGRPICYPNGTYYGFGQPNYRLVYGVNLATAYTLLGQKAVAYLAAPGDMGLDTPPPVQQGPA